MSGVVPWTDGEGGIAYAGTRHDGTLVLTVTDPVGAADERSATLAVGCLERFVAWLYEQAGRVPPIVLPRPEINPRASAELGSLGVWLAEGGEVVVALGCVAVPLDAGAALEWAGLVAAYAQASTARAPEHDADAVRLASLLTDVSRMAPEDAARYLLGKGVTPGKDGGNG